MVDKTLYYIESQVYSKCGLSIQNFEKESESQEYEACRFILNTKRIISRNAKITPKKIGQFVTFWKRGKDGFIEPFKQSDLFDFYVINVKTETEFGQFVFPKYALAQKSIISTERKDGKRGFRVYPGWDTPTSKQAQQTQKWQLKYFYRINNSIDFKKVKNLYEKDL